MTKCEIAETAIAVYEVAVFSAVGHNDKITATRIEVLGVDALDACSKAARDRTVNQVTRDYYAKEAAWFRAQHGA
jgi:hypothetical protein